MEHHSSRAVEARFPIDEAVPFGGGLPGASANSLTVWREGDQTNIVVGGELGELRVRYEGERWESPERYFDDRFRASPCGSAVDAGGQAQAPPELAELTILRATDDSAWILAAPDEWSRVLATAPNGCTSVFDLKLPFFVDDSRTLTVIRPSTDTRSALIGGRGSLLVELEHRTVWNARCNAHLRADPGGLVAAVLTDVQYAPCPRSSGARLSLATVRFATAPKPIGALGP